MLFTKLIGTANAIPANCPCPLPCVPGERIAVLMPMTSPALLSSGPPLLPGLTAASV